MPNTTFEGTVKSVSLKKLVVTLSDGRTVAVDLSDSNNLRYHSGVLDASSGKLTPKVGDQIRLICTVHTNGSPIEAFFGIPTEPHLIKASPEQTALFNAARKEHAQLQARMTSLITEGRYREARKQLSTLLAKPLLKSEREAARLLAHLPISDERKIKALAEGHAALMQTVLQYAGRKEEGDSLKFFGAQSAAEEMMVQFSVEARGKLDQHLLPIWLKALKLITADLLEPNVKSEKTEALK